jgi:hypothetical protein
LTCRQVPASCCLFYDAVDICATWKKPARRLDFR